MKFRAEIVVTLREGVLDPQGQAVRDGLFSMGYAGVRDVRVGRHIEIELEAAGEAEARAAVDEMTRRLLANPVIEEYRFTLQTA